MEAVERIGKPTGFSCPVCQKPLLRVEKVKSSVFRCLEGHTFSSETLMEAHSRSTADHLWRVIQCADEAMSLMKELAQCARESGLESVAVRWNDKIGRLDTLSATIRLMLLEGRE
jgi:two-component system chemotaxis response regulator CheB